MKKVTMFVLAVGVLFIAGCSEKADVDYPLHNKLVRDREGRVYQIGHYMGDTYYVRPLEGIVIDW